MSPSAPISATPPASGSTLPRWAWMAGGGALLLISGLASALVFRGKPVDAEAASPVAVVAHERIVATKPVAKPIVKAAATCNQCGVVESVQAIQQKGAGTGVGAVAGGVLGGVLGHQMGGGSGKTAMTVLGAVGGGVAGNEVEKRARAETVYQVRVRMDDGTTRTMSLGNAPVAKGDRVTVEGQSLRRLNADATS